MGVRDQRHSDTMAHFQLLNVEAFFIQQKGRDIDRYLRVHGGRVFLHRLLLQDAQDVQ
jgi:hypothetical protein